MSDTWRWKSMGNTERLRELWRNLNPEEVEAVVERIKESFKEKGQAAHFERKRIGGHLYLYIRKWVKDKGRRRHISRYVGKLPKGRE